MNESGQDPKKVFLEKKMNDLNNKPRMNRPAFGHSGLRNNQENSKTINSLNNRKSNNIKNYNINNNSKQQASEQNDNEQTEQENTLKSDSASFFKENIANKFLGKNKQLISSTSDSDIETKIIKLIKKKPHIVLLCLILIMVIFLPILVMNEDEASDNSDTEELTTNYQNKVLNDSMISLTHTDLTKEEFITACSNQSSTTGFFDKCEKIYDISVSKNFNPEMVVIRATVEGFSPYTDKPSTNNYWGLGCYNGKGIDACSSYSSFDEGVKAFIKNVSQYNTVEDMMSKYAYIGNNWYNPGSSSGGGCYYYQYIEKYMSDTRKNTVEGYCSSGNTCSGTACFPTNDEDQLAYSKWQVSHMVEVGNNIFGRVTPEKASSNSIAMNIPESVDDLKSRYYFTYDKDVYLGYERQNNHLFAQCVWYANHRAQEIVASSNLSQEEKDKRIASIKSTSGNGQDVAPNMDSSIFKKVKDPNEIKAPAVISWSYGGYGHVAIVESVEVDSSGNKTFIISEGWRQRDGAGRTWLTHNSIEELWSVTRFNKYSTDVVGIKSYSGTNNINGVAMLLE